MCCSHPISSIYPHLDPVVPSPWPMAYLSHPVRCHLLPTTVPPLAATRRRLRPPIGRALSLHPISLHPISDLVTHDASLIPADSTSTASSSDQRAQGQWNWRPDLEKSCRPSSPMSFSAFPDPGVQLNTSYSSSTEARKQILHSGIAVARIYVSKMA
ncbi:hypothetical protein EJB05_15322 [Eragrostis curvula]|uniref:Uncharacterized protein n=1 Tax=Eragrostis curvula TaxID=38414 RepID=A0A5J9W2P5_9POAL|nr:hypothetical protein EJB05_15322 [Eragrostis curvula]